MVIEIIECADSALLLVVPRRRPVVLPVAQEKSCEATELPEPQSDRRGGNSAPPRRASKSA